MGIEFIDQPGQSSEVEHNQKMSISFFWLERAGRWGSSPSTSPADCQKLNVIQKRAFHFFGWRGIQVHRVLVSTAVLNQPLSVNLTLFGSTCRCTPPRIGKAEASGSELLMYPPPPNDKVGFQVKVTFWIYLQMYPPQDWKS